MMMTTTCVMVKISRARCLCKISIKTIGNLFSSSTMSCSLPTADLSMKTSNTNAINFSWMLLVKWKGDECVVKRFNGPLLRFINRCHLSKSGKLLSSYMLNSSPRRCRNRVWNVPIIVEIKPWKCQSDSQACIVCPLRENCRAFAGNSFNAVRLVSLLSPQSIANKRNCWLDNNTRFHSLKQICDVSGRVSHIFFIILSC